MVITGLLSKLKKCWYFLPVSSYLFIFFFSCCIQYAVEFFHHHFASFHKIQYAAGVLECNLLMPSSVSGSWNPSDQQGGPRKSIIWSVFSGPATEQDSKGFPKALINLSCSLYFSLLKRSLSQQMSLNLFFKRWYWNLCLLPKTKISSSSSLTHLIRMAKRLFLDYFFLESCCSVWGHCWSPFIYCCLM